jgi:sigma-B regulation protein RsbU (phosphoserine phosphatase)
MPAIWQAKWKKECIFLPFAATPGLISTRLAWYYRVLFGASPVIGDAQTTRGPFKVHWLVHNGGLGLAMRYHVPVPDEKWREHLAAVDRVMRDISRISDPEELVTTYWRGLGHYLPSQHYVTVSRRAESPPFYRVTRSSRMPDGPNPWTHRKELPLLSGGILGEIAYANQPVIIDDLPARLRPDDPGYFYLEGFGALFSVPQYDNGEGLNASSLLIPIGHSVDHSVIPRVHWETSLFGRATQNLVLRNQLAQAHAHLEREAKVVGEIQRSLLPEALPTIPGVDLAVRYETATNAGGDLYDVFRVDQDLWAFLIADVSGHGTPAAVLMAIVHALVRSHAAQHRSPSALLEVMNEHLHASYAKGGSFVTAFYGVLSLSARRLQFASAGHNPPMLLRGHRMIELREPASVPLGILPGQVFETGEIGLESGDTLAMFTDGIVEAMSPEASKAGTSLFGAMRLRQVLDEAINAQGRVDAVWKRLREFAGPGPAADDQTLLVARFGTL